MQQTLQSAFLQELIDGAAWTSVEVSREHSYALIFSAKVLKELEYSV